MKLRKIVVNITVVKKPFGIKFGEKGEKPSVRANEAGLLLVADLLTSMFQAAYGTLPVRAVTSLLGGGWLVVFVLRTPKKRQGIGGFAGMLPMSAASRCRANKARMFTVYLLLGLALLN